MSSKCSEHHSQYIYHSSAYSIAAELDRPCRLSLPTQGAAVLPVTGGRSTQSVGKLSWNGLVSFENAYVEVGGSYDKCHDIQTSYFSSVIEGLNIADVLTADRVVGRMQVYSPQTNHGGEHTFDITGSYFDNLRIAGCRIDASLDTGAFHKLNSYSEFTKAYKSGEADSLLLFSELGKLAPADMAELEETYHPLCGISQMVKTWKEDSTREPKERYLCSALSHLNLQSYRGRNSELKGHGAVICIPKFGVIRLGEVLVTKQFRSLTMFMVQNGSSSSGVVTGCTGSTGGGNGFP